MPGYGYGYMGYAHPMMWDHGDIFGGLLWIVIAVIVIAFALRALRHNRRGGFHHWGCSSSGVHTLEERYAKGEIDTAEFEERRRVLRGW